MKKVIFFIFIIWITNIHSQSPPIGIPKDAQWVPIINHWSQDFLYTKDQAIQIDWDLSKELIFISITNEYNGISKTIKYKKNNIIADLQTMRVNDRGAKNLYDFPEESWHSYGKCFEFYTNDKFKKVTNYYASKELMVEDGPDIDNRCGREIFYDESGKIKKVINHKAKCLQGSAMYKPIIPVGRYKVTASVLKVREKSDVKSKFLFKISKNEIVDVTEDTKIMMTDSYETAPWVKIKTKDGKTGYVFAGFLEPIDWYKYYNDIFTILMDLSKKQ